MTQRNILVLSVPMSLAVRENPPTGRMRQVAIAYSTTLIAFLKQSGLLRADSPVWDMEFEEAEIFSNDLTPEGQDFFMAQQTINWLGARERKSNDMLRQGASDEARLEVYRDSKGLFRRLEKFRKERRARAN